MPTADVLNIQVKLTGVQQAMRQMQQLQNQMNQTRGGRSSGGGGGSRRGGGGGGGGRGFWVGDAFQATGILIRGAEQVGSLMVSGAKAAVHAYESFAGFKVGAQTLLGEKAGAAFAKKFQEFAIPNIYNTESLRNAALQMIPQRGADATLRTLQNTSEIMAGTGLMDREQADSVLRALRDIAGKGKVQAEEFTKQLSNAAPALAQLIAKEAGGLTKVLPGANKKPMSADEFFNIIDRIAERGGFAGSQKELAKKSLSLRWGQIMDLLEYKLIDVGEQFAMGVMDGLNALEEGVGKINWTSLAQTAKKWGEEVGKFIKFLVNKLPEFEQWIKNFDLKGIANAAKFVINSIALLADKISGNEGLIVWFLAATVAARTLAAVLGSFKLILGETGLMGLIKKLTGGGLHLPTGGGGGGGGIVGMIPGIGSLKNFVPWIKKIIGSRAGQVAGSAATSYLPSLAGSAVATGATATGTGLAGLLTGAVTGTIASVAIAVVASAAVAVVAYKLTSMLMDSITGGDYNQWLSDTFARQNGATIDADGNEIYGPDSHGRGLSDASRARAGGAGGSGAREMARRKQATFDNENAQIGISPEYYRELMKGRSKAERPVRHDDIRRVMGRSQYNTLRQV